MNDPGEIILFQTEDGQTRVDVRLVNETVWLSAGQMADLFQRDKSTISRHIQNVYDEGELKREATVALFATVQKEGEREITRDIAERREGIRNRLHGEHQSQRSDW